MLFIVSFIGVTVRMLVRSPGFRPSLADGLVVTALASAFAFCLWTVSKRPAGTNMFEVATILIGLTAAVLGWGARDEQLRRVAAIMLPIFVAVSLARFGFMREIRTLAATADSADVVWQLHQDILNDRKPAVVVIPNNSYVAGTVEEGLMKGYADFPTWVVTTGKAGIKRWTNGIASARRAVVQHRPTRTQMESH